MNLKRSSMWYFVLISALEAQSKLGGEDLIPFYGLLDGGREGELFAELEDYFYYAQIRRLIIIDIFGDDLSDTCINIMHLFTTSFNPYSVLLAKFYNTDFTISRSQKIPPKKSYNKIQNIFFNTEITFQ